MSVEIRPAGTADGDAVRAVEIAAFGEAEEADLVAALLADPTAQPALSLLAFEDGAAIGHVLFTAARLDGAPEAPPLAILAPLAVIPGAQRRGVGRSLIEAGAAALAADGVAAMFVLGDPAYYGRHGFVPAVPLGLPAPHPTPADYPDAWRVRTLQPGALDGLRGTIRCADALDHPEYWGDA